MGSDTRRQLQEAVKRAYDAALQDYVHHTGRAGKPAEAAAREAVKEALRRAEVRL